MPKQRKWTDDGLIEAVQTSKSYRSVLIKNNLVPAGGNYTQIKKRISELNLDTSHFTGKGWNTGGFTPVPAEPLENLLVKNRSVQSYKLKNKLFAAGIKKRECELCGWKIQSKDGRIPVELDHINGDRLDNRLKNLRILCPNCHSLQPTHRGKNIGR